MAKATPNDPTEGGEGSNAGKGYRLPPHPQEHARRVAWGKRFGPLVRAAYQKELQRNEGQ